MRRCTQSLVFHLDSFLALFDLFGICGPMWQSGFCACEQLWPDQRCETKRTFTAPYCYTVFRRTKLHLSKLPFLSLLLCAMLAVSASTSMLSPRFVWSLGYFSSLFVCFFSLGPSDKPLAHFSLLSFQRSVVSDVQPSPTTIQTNTQRHVSFDAGKIGVRCCSCKFPSKTRYFDLCADCKTHTLCRSVGSVASRCCLAVPVVLLLLSLSRCRGRFQVRFLSCFCCSSAYLLYVWCFCSRTTTRNKNNAVAHSIIVLRCLLHAPATHRASALVFSPFVSPVVCSGLIFPLCCFAAGFGVWPFLLFLLLTFAAPVSSLYMSWHGAYVLSSGVCQFSNVLDADRCVCPSLTSRTTNFSVWTTALSTLSVCTGSSYSSFGGMYQMTGTLFFIFCCYF